jgi:hypothetical protein
MLSEESTQYLVVLRAFLFSERTKNHDSRIQALIDQIDQELSKRRKLAAGPVRQQASTYSNSFYTATS